MAPVIAASGAELELTDVVNYVLSVVFTEADAFFDSIVIEEFESEISLNSAINNVIDWIDAGKSTVTPPVFVDQVGDWRAAFDTFREANTDKFGVSGSIRVTLDDLVQALPVDNTLITDVMDDIFGTDEPTV